MKLGEILEASTHQFMAQSYELHNPPPLGGWVRTSEGMVTIYGVVSHAATESTDPGRRPIARGMDLVDEADVYRQNPQLFQLFRTVFQALVVGHEAGGALKHYLPPRPARVHAFVYLCPPEEVRRFTLSFDFLNLLMRAPGQGQMDEVVAACLRHASQAHPDAWGFLVRGGKELALLLRGDLNRLNALLGRIRE